MFWHFICCKQDHFLYIYIYTPVILEYCQIILMLFGITWACNMSSHFVSANLWNTSESFWIYSLWCFGSFCDWLMLVGDPATCTTISDRISNGSMLLERSKSKSDGNIQWWTIKWRSVFRYEKQISCGEHRLWGSSRRCSQQKKERTD